MYVFLFRFLYNVFYPIRFYIYIKFALYIRMDTNSIKNSLEYFKHREYSKEKKNSLEYFKQRENGTMNPDSTVIVRFFKSNVKVFFSFRKRDV